MFFVTSKLLVWLIYPFTLGLLLLVFAYLAVLWKRKTLFHCFFLMGLLLLYGFSIEPVADVLLRPLERRHLPENLSGLKADAIVVLAGDVRKGVFPRDDIEVGGSRVLKGVRLYRRKAAPLIIMSGGSGDLFDPNFKEAELMKELAVELGVPRDKILVESQSRNTRENMARTKQLLDEIKAGKIILVTSAFHIPRSLAILRKLGVDAVPAPSDFYVTDEKYDLFSFVPDLGNLGRSSVAIKEHVGIYVYRLMGWS